MSAVEAMGCAAEPVGRSEAGHCLASSAANAAGVAYPGEECSLSRLILRPGSDRDAGMGEAEEQRLVE